MATFHYTLRFGKHFRGQRKAILTAKDPPYQGPAGLLQVIATGNLRTLDDLFNGGKDVERILKWLATFGLIANRRPCPGPPAGQCASPAPPSDMNLIADKSREDGFIVRE